MNITLAIVLLLLAIGGVVVRKTYFSVPLRELKRRAERHDRNAAQLYRAAAYGNSLRGLLWLYIGLTSAASFIVLARLLPVWVSLLVIGPVLWIVFSLMPAGRTTGAGLWLTRLVTPLVAGLLGFLHPLLSRGTEAVERRYDTGRHTGLFEREDLVRLIERQQGQADNRLSAEELEIAKRALQFGTYHVADILTPRKQIKTVTSDDTVGPILIDELHKSGQHFALVRETSKGPVVGTLETSHLGITSKGKVRDLMDETVYYLHEDDSLSEALHAFFVTNHPVFLVVNGFEEYVGIVTVQSMLQQLLGHVPGDDFDQYADPAAVAGRYPRTLNSDKTDETPVKTDDKMVE